MQPSTEGLPTHHDEPFCCKLIQQAIDVSQCIDASPYAFTINSLIAVTADVFL